MIGDLEFPSVTPAIADTHRHRATERAREPVGPLDTHNSVSFKQFFQTQVVYFFGGQSVEVDVIHGAAAVFLNQGERGTAHLIRWYAPPLRESSDECCLPGPELTVQQDDTSWAQRASQVGGDSGSVALRVTDPTLDHQAPDKRANASGTVLVPASESPR